MKDNTVKLSGHAKDRFVERFFAEEAGLDDVVRRRLVLRAKGAFTSLRVRKALLGRRIAVSNPSTADVNKLPSPALAPAATSAARPATDVSATEPAGDGAFDAYAIGLVPVFQREGAEGLVAKLGGISRVDHLRAMAKAQQIVLPQELRSGDASVEAVRAGIAEAVAKRIKDRRAAAG